MHPTNYMEEQYHMNTKRFIRIIKVTIALVVSIVFIHSIWKSDANSRSILMGIIGTVLSVSYTHYKTKEREISARHFSEKRECYMKFIDLLFDVILSEKQNSDIFKETIAKQIPSFKKEMIVWGGSDIIETWNSFEMQEENNPSLEERVRMLDGILRVIRKDLGHNDSMLPHGSLVALFLATKDKKTLLSK